MSFLCEDAMAGRRIRAGEGGRTGECVGVGAGVSRAGEGVRASDGRRAGEDVRECDSRRAGERVRSGGWPGEAASW